MTKSRTAMTIAALVFGALTTQAASTPVAVWDRNFNTATSGIYTLNLNGNTADLSEDKSTTNALTISSTNGILIDSTGATLNNHTIIVRCSGINLKSSEKQTLWTTQGGDYKDATGVALNANNASVCGINGSNYSDYSESLKIQVSVEIPTNYTSLVFQYKNDAYTKAYAITTDGVTNIYAATGLRWSKWSSTQLALGGLRGTNSDYSAATGMKITSIAIFNTQMSETEIAAYLFPIEAAAAEEEKRKAEEEAKKKAEEEAKARDEATRKAAVTIPTVAVSNVTVTTTSDATLALDFVVSGATDYAADYLICVTATNGETVTKATTLSGATNCVNGAHRVYWDIKTDNYTHDANATIAITFKPIAYYVIDLAEGTKEGASYPVTCYTEEIDGGFNKDEYKTSKLVLKRVEAGLFEMGTTSNLVAITKAFYMGLFEVTQKQWNLVTGTNHTYKTSEIYTGSTMTGDAKPVFEVAYSEIRGATNGAAYPATIAVDEDSFLGLLRKRSGINFDLPTEAQWEYTCRAGTSTTYSWGDEVNDAYLWYTGNSTNANDSTICDVHNVGTKLPNAWGFYDMAGSVTEMCADYYSNPLTTVGIDPVGPESGGSRVYRDGGFYSDADYCTSFVRGEQKDKPSFAGFRLAGPTMTTAASEDPVPEISANATTSEIAAALEGAGDATLVKKVTTCEAYNNYRAWVKTIAGDVIADRKNVKASAHGYFGYALNLSALPTALPQDGDLTVASLAASTTTAGAWTLALSLKDCEIGSGALSTNLEDLFTVECTKDLSSTSAWTTDLVETTFETPENGDAILSVKPKDTAATSLFIRLKLSL